MFIVNGKSPVTTLSLTSSLHRC